MLKDLHKKLSFREISTQQTPIYSTKNCNFANWVCAHDALSLSKNNV